jgi:peptidoglycan/LPS O-acetylase OafA/YrhL
MGFFIGVAVFMMLLRIRLDLLRKAKNAIFVAAILGWTSVLLEFKFGALHHLAHLGFGFVSPNAQSFFDRFSNGAFLIIFDFTVVPATIAAAALYERVSPVSLKRLHWIGDISYSSYLLHFPLQLFFAILMVAGTAPLTWRTSGWFMLSFYFLLIPLSFATFCYFERPTQNWLRQKWRALSGTGRGPARAGGPHTAERRD